MIGNFYLAYDNYLYIVALQTNTLIYRLKQLSNYKYLNYYTLEALEYLEINIITGTIESTYRKA